MNLDKVIREHWQAYYKSPGKHGREYPSPFAEWCIRTDRLRDGSLVLELGCGTGVDARFFARHGYKVYALDLMPPLLDEPASSPRYIPPLFISCDFSDPPEELFQYAFGTVYARFSLHAVPDEARLRTLDNVQRLLAVAGRFCIETRTLDDPLYGKGERVDEHAFVLDGHFRRFLSTAELTDELRQRGFSIRHSETGTGLSPYDDEDPVILRIVARKEPCSKTT